MWGDRFPPARDGAVYQKTLDNLLEAYEMTLEADAFSDLQTSLSNLYSVRLGKLIEHEEILHNLVNELKKSHTRLQQLALQETGWSAIAPNLHRIYRQGRERFYTAYDEGSDTAFHEWRKRVKDLWYDTRLLKRLWPPVMDAFEDEAHRLSSLLGDSHDIAELRHFFAPSSGRDRVARNRAKSPATADGTSPIQATPASPRTGPKTLR